MDSLYLIEKFGGYDVVKNAVKNYRDSGDKISMGNFEHALLEYRRANNTFEVGDKVIKTHPKNTILWPVLGVYRDGGVWLDYKGFNWKPPRVRHATDAEIAAGHRL